MRAIVFILVSFLLILLPIFSSLPAWAEEDEDIFIAEAHKDQTWNGWPARFGAYLEPKDKLQFFPRYNIGGPGLTFVSGYVIPLGKKMKLTPWIGASFDGKTFDLTYYRPELDFSFKLPWSLKGQFFTSLAISASESTKEKSFHYNCLSLTWGSKWSKISLGLKAENLLDKDYNLSFLNLGPILFYRIGEGGDYKELYLTIWGGWTHYPEGENRFYPQSQGSDVIFLRFGMVVRHE